MIQGERKVKPINLIQRKALIYIFKIELIKIVLLFFFFPFPALSAIKQGTIEFLTGRYQLDEPRFKAVYSENGPIYGLGLSANLLTPLNFYLDIKYFQREGTLTYTKEKTQFYLLPLSLGLRAVVPIGFLNPFIGTGADFYTYFEDNPIGTVLNFTNGYHFMAGIYIQAGKLPVFLSARFKYTRAQAEEEKGRRIQLGGLETLLSFGFIF